MSARAPPLMVVTFLAIPWAGRPRTRAKALCGDAAAASRRGARGSSALPIRDRERRVTSPAVPRCSGSLRNRSTGERRAGDR